MLHVTPTGFLPEVVAFEFTIQFHLGGDKLQRFHTLKVGKRDPILKNNTPIPSIFRCLCCWWTKDIVIVVMFFCCVKKNTTFGMFSVVVTW